jgi:hypothetical protein
MRLLMGLKLCAEKRYRKELDRQLRKRIPVGQHFIQEGTAPRGFCFRHLQQSRIVAFGPKRRMDTIYFKFKVGQHVVSPSPDCYVHCGATRKESNYRNNDRSISLVRLAELLVVPPHFRNKVHPRQADYYRGDKHAHFITAQGICSVYGNIIYSVHLAVGRNCDKSVFVLSGIKDDLQRKGVRLLADQSYKSYDGTLVVPQTK